MPDYRLNSRSPYYIDGEVQITEVTPPPPVEENTPPTVTITASNESPYVGETVILTAVATDSDGTVVGYQWSTGGTSTQVEATSSSAACIDFYVEVTDDDGDTATATKRICWQAVPAIITNPEAIEVYCGETFGEGAFTGEMVYSIVDIGDKIGDIEIVFADPPVTSYENYDVPVNFSLEWNGLSASTGYVGNSEYDAELQARGVQLSDIVTLSTTTKVHPTALTLAKTAATPTEVLIRATTPLVNDQFELTINCPQVIPAAPTKYYTLEGTDAGGDTTFTYTDKNGDSQNVVLSNGETELVSAREDTVSVVSGTGDITEGGDSFDNGTPAQDYDANTELIIVVDNTASMGQTASEILSMANGNLKDKLISFYNGSLAEYEKKVRVISFLEFRDNYTYIPGDTSTYYSEDFLKFVKYGKINPEATKTIYMVFADEARYRYQTSVLSSTYSGSAGSIYQTDLTAYRSFLDSIDYGTHFFKMFKIDSTPNDNQFFLNIFNGTEGFSGSKGLSDRSEVSIEPTVLTNAVSYSSNPTYYYNFVIQSLQDYGFNI